MELEGRIWLKMKPESAAFRMCLQGLLMEWWFFHERGVKWDGFDLCVCSVQGVCQKSTPAAGPWASPDLS